MYLVENQVSFGVSFLGFDEGIVSLKALFENIVKSVICFDLLGF